MQTKQKNKLKIDTQLFVDQYSNDISYLIEECFSADVLDQLANKTGFVFRCRKLTGSGFINTLMFSGYSKMKTSLPDYTGDLAKNFGIAISRESLAVG